MKKILTESENLRRLSNIVTDDIQLNEYFVKSGMTLREIFSSLFPDPKEEEEAINDMGFGIQSLTLWHDTHKEIQQLEQRWQKHSNVRVSNDELIDVIENHAGYLEYSLDEEEDYLDSLKEMRELIELLNSLELDDLTSDEFYFD